MIKNNLPVIVAQAGYKHGDFGPLAKRLGCSKPTLRAMLYQEGYEPKLGLALRTAKHFGKHVEEIWWEEEE